MLCVHSSLVGVCDHLALLQSPARGTEMTKLSGVVRMLKKEHDRLTKEVNAIAAALSAFGATYGKQNRTRGSNRRQGGQGSRPPRKHNGRE